MSIFIKRRGMQIDELLKESKSIWSGKCDLREIIVRMGKVFGDICRWSRNDKKDEAIHTETELKKELGNIIFSTIRWCNDLGYDPKECINLAIDCQKKYEK
jgi:hypothetical protein